MISKFLAFVYSRSLEQFFLTLGQNNFDNKIPYSHDFILGKDDDLHSTSTVIIMERLQVGDRIYTKMDLDEGGDGASVLHSQKVNPSIHFVGQRISDWFLKYILFRLNESLILRNSNIDIDISNKKNSGHHKCHKQLYSTCA